MAFTATDLMIEVLPAEESLQTGRAEEAAPGCGACTACSACSNCSDCSNCSGCTGCTGCSDCTGCSGCTDNTNAQAGYDPTELAALERELQVVIAGR